MTYGADWQIPYWGKKFGVKWLNFLQVTKFFPDFLFPDQYFSPIFFHLTKNLFQFFFSVVIIINIIIIIFPIYLQNLLWPWFFCTLFFVVEQRSFNINFELRVKARNWKNSRNCDRNATRNCTFVNFKN